MSLVGFKARNHRQQVQRRGANDEVDDRGTDPVLFARLTERFSFDIDVAASNANAKCERYFTRETDGLAQPWAGRVWCNPPWSTLRPWVEKAWREWDAGRVDAIVMLLPANRTEQTWWQDLVEPRRDRPGSPLRVEFMPGRPRFVNRGKAGIGPNERPPCGCCLLIWGPRSTTTTTEVHP